MGISNFKISFQDEVHTHSRITIRVNMWDASRRDWTPTGIPGVFMCDPLGITISETENGIFNLSMHMGMVNGGGEGPGGGMLSFNVHDTADNRKLGFINFWIDKNGIGVSNVGQEHLRVNFKGWEGVGKVSYIELQDK